MEQQQTHSALRQSTPLGPGQASRGVRFTPNPTTMATNVPTGSGRYQYTGAGQTPPGASASLEMDRVRTWDAGNSAPAPRRESEAGLSMASDSQHFSASQVQVPVEQYGTPQHAPQQPPDGAMDPEDELQPAVEPDAETDDSVMSTASSHATSKGSGKEIGSTTFRICGSKLRVPFTVWTFVAMLVPIGLLVSVTAVQLADTAHELDTIADHRGVADAIGECCGFLMRERGTLGPYLVRGGDADFATLTRNRGGVDLWCGQELTQELRKLTHKSSAVSTEIWETELARHIRMLGELEVWRNEVNARRANGRLTREFHTLSITATAEMLTHVANGLSKSARSFSGLLLLLTTRNYLGLARGVGNAIAALSPTADYSLLYIEYSRGYSQSHSSYALLKGMAEPELRTHIDEWFNTAVAQSMWQLLDTMADPVGGVVRIQQNNATTWWPVVSAGMNALHQVEKDEIERIHSGEARSDLRNSALIMSLGTLACLVAAGLLAYKQMRVRHQLESQMKKIVRTKAAVSAFVPRFFLQKMGYTSITQAMAGDSTNVALAMLFSDIRRFTTVSEGMIATELFDWVQGYFKRMTSIVEARRGNVNQFVGDAMFAVFSLSSDAVQCAVDMQGDVDQLNVQRLRENSTTIPIEVGVGIHHDVVALGILGDQKRHTCTAISASVNLASRLEGLTKQLGCKIIASEAAISQLTETEARGMRMRRMGRVLVKGSAAGVPIFDVFHSDERDLQLYKAVTREVFEALVPMIQDHSPSVAVKKAIEKRLKGFVKIRRGVFGEVEKTKEVPDASMTPTTGAKELPGEASVSQDAPPMLPAPVMPNAVPEADAAAQPAERQAQSPESPVSAQNEDMPSSRLLQRVMSSSMHNDAMGSSTLMPRTSMQGVDAATSVMIDNLFGQLERYDVRDLGLEIIIKMADGSGLLSFLMK